MRALQFASSTFRLGSGFLSSSADVLASAMKVP
jgi:hypothetical protein